MDIGNGLEIVTQQNPFKLRSGVYLTTGTHYVLTRSEKEGFPQ